MSVANLNGDQLEMETSSHTSAAVRGVDSDSPGRVQTQWVEANESAPLSVGILLDNSDGSDAVPKEFPNPSIPQTVVSSTSSSSPSLKDAPSGVAPYGTRSRNRAGVSRPNYAEDREIDMEFEVQPPIKEDDTRKGNRALDNRSTMVEPTAAGATGRKSTGTGPDEVATAQLVLKDHIPGTSTFSAHISGNNPTQPSKKRKATTNSTSSITNGNHFTGNVATTMATNKSVLSQNVQAYKESFMLSFNNCAARLQNNKLVADDGTTLAINGELTYISLC